MNCVQQQKKGNYLRLIDWRLLNLRFANQFTWNNWYWWAIWLEISDCQMYTQQRQSAMCIWWFGECVCVWARFRSSKMLSVAFSLHKSFAETCTYPAVAVWWEKIVGGNTHCKYIAYLKVPEHSACTMYSSTLCAVCMEYTHTQNRISEPVNQSILGWTTRVSNILSMAHDTFHTQKKQSVPNYTKCTTTK